MNTQTRRLLRQPPVAIQERLRTLPRCLRQVQQCSRQTYDCVIQVQICNGVVHVQAPPPCKRTVVNASSQRSGRTKTIAPQSCPIGNLVHDTCRLSSSALLAVGLQSGRQGGLAGVGNTSLLQLGHSSRFNLLLSAMDSTANRLLSLCG